MKTHGNITLEPTTNPTDPPGTLHWRLPTGRTYTSPPPTLLTRTLHTDDDPPPF